MDQTGLRNRRRTKDNRDNNNKNKKKRREDSLWALGSTAVHEMTTTNLSRKVTEEISCELLPVPHLFPNVMAYLQEPRRLFWQNNNKTRHQNNIENIYSNWKKLRYKTTATVLIVSNLLPPHTYGE